MRPMLSVARCCCDKPASTWVTYSQRVLPNEPPISPLRRFDNASQAWKYTGSRSDAHGGIVHVDDSENTYVLMRYSTTIPQRKSIEVVDADGNKTREISLTFNPDAKNFALTTTEVIIVDDRNIQAYTTAGAASWSDGLAHPLIINDIAPGTDDSVVIVHNSLSDSDETILKINSSGTRDWHKNIGALSLLAVAVDTTNNIWTMGATSSNAATIYKLDSTGAIVFQDEVLLQLGTAYTGIILCDGDDNVYADFRTPLGGALQQSRDSDGDIRWTRSNLTFYAVSDDDGNIYFQHFFIEKDDPTNFGTLVADDPFDFPFRNAVSPGRAAPFR